MANIITIWSQFFLTDAGLRLRQQSIATGAELIFCFAKIGQGVPENPANIPLMTDVVSAAEEVPVVRSEAESVTHYVGVRVDNKDFKQPVLMTEIGLYARIGDDEPVLYGYTYATQGYDSIPAGKISHYIWTIGIDTVISRAQSISFTYDGSKVYATEEEIDTLIQAFDKFREKTLDVILKEQANEISAAKTAAEDAKTAADEVKKKIDSGTGVSASTLGGKTADYFAAADHKHSASDISGLPTSLPANGGNADTVGGAAVMTTAALGLHRMASGTAAPTSATCPPGCWYGQYE